MDQEDAKLMFTQKALQEFSPEIQKQIINHQSSYYQQAINQPPRGEYLSKKQQKMVEKSIEKSEEEDYKYLKPSVKIKTGLFKEEFDIRFSQIRDTMVTKNLISLAMELYPEFQRFNKANPHIRNEPTAEDQEEKDRILKLYKPNFSIATERDIRYTWIGHSTVVMQIGPDNFMLDPIFSDRASPVQLFGPKRFQKPPCTIPQLPHINAVFISHDHYDHMDQPSLQMLHKCFKPIFIAGLGSGDVLPKNSNQMLMDWMDSKVIEINGRSYRITFVPTCHWGKRKFHDLNTRLWGGVIIETPFDQKIYYSGDTGYCPVFKEIGRKFGPFDLTVLPIGAYLPRDALKPQHVDPEEAVIVHRQLRSRQSVAVHWGTFPLGAQGFCQAYFDLIEAKMKHNMPDNEFITVYHGETVIFKKGVPFHR